MIDWLIIWSEQNPLDINCFELPDIQKTTHITEGELCGNWQQHQDYAMSLSGIFTWLGIQQINSYQHIL